jgi:glycosyltransferase involved in cell wall biosynthesis
MESTENKKVLLLSNIVAPYRIPLLLSLSRKFASLGVIYDAIREPGRLWDLDLGEIDATKSLGTLRIRKNLSLDAGQTVYVHTLLLTQVIASKPDVLISNELGSRAFWAVIYKLLNPKVKFISWLTLSEWTERNRGSTRGLLRKFLLNHADAFVVSSSSAKRYVHSWNSNAQVFVAPQSAAMPLATGARAVDSNLESADKSIKFAFVGNPSPRKNLFNLLNWLDEWSTVTNSKVRLSVAGVTPPTVPANHNPNLIVKYLGYVNQQTLLELYDSSDAMVFPTLEDEWGLVVNEALARGCPVIGSIYSEAVVELVEDGSNGWQFDPLDRDTFFVAMDKFVKIYRDSSAYSNLRSRALESAEAASIVRFAAAFSEAVSFCFEKAHKA